jgi:cytochrome P450
MGSVEGLKWLRGMFGETPFVRITTGHTTSLFARTTDAFREIVVKQADIFIKPIEVYGVLNIYGLNIVTTNDTEWKIHRRVCDPAFSEKHMRFMVEESVNSTELMFARWGPKKELNIDVHKEMTDVTMDVIGKTNFGTDLGVYKELKYDERAHSMSFRKALEISLTMGLLVRGILPNWMSFMFPGTCKAVDEVGLYVGELIEQSKQGRERFDLLSLIARANETALELSKKDMIADSFVFVSCS